MIINDTIRHFTATTFVVHRDRTLLHHHKGLQMWLPPGGHIEENELPHMAAIREVLEETGLHVTLLVESVVEGIEKADVSLLPCPRYILLEDIEEGHQHIDMIYFATASSFELSPAPGETGKIKWFTREEINSSDVLCDDVKILAIKALEAVN